MIEDIIPINSIDDKKVDNIVEEDDLAPDDSVSVWEPTHTSSVLATEGNMPPPLPLQPVVRVTHSLCVTLQTANGAPESVISLAKLPALTTQVNSLAVRGMVLLPSPQCLQFHEKNKIKSFLVWNLFG